MEILWILIIQVLQVVAFHQQHAVKKNAYSFVMEFAVCRSDQKTGILGYKGKETELYTTCALNLLANRYCQLQCFFEAFGTIDKDTGKPNNRVIDEFVDKFPDFHGRESLRNASKTCIHEKTYPSTKDCEKVREWYYCFYNEFTKICKLEHTRKEKRVDVDSPEVGILDAFGRSTGPDIGLR